MLFARICVDMVDAGANRIQASAMAVPNAGTAATGAGTGAAAAVASSEAAPLSEAELKLREELNALRVRRLVVAVCKQCVTTRTPDLVCQYVLVLPAVLVSQDGV